MNRFDNLEFKKYQVTMEKAISAFDGITEWQDIIGFLSKIHKLIKGSTFSDIPKKALLAKRLAQTLSSGLPSGVHQKSLQVYQAIFESAGVTCF
jgi:hypothetical protein